MAADMANKQEVGHDNRLSDLQTQIDELLAEMSECREDERSAQNQTVQIIATAGTILTLIYGANLIPKEIIPQQMLFHLSNLVFCAAVGFITALGISNVLRYHYIQNIEDRLYCLVSNSLVEEEPIIHWMSFSAPCYYKKSKKFKKIIYLDALFLLWSCDNMSTSVLCNFNNSAIYFFRIIYYFG